MGQLTTHRFQHDNGYHQLPVRKDHIRSCQGHHFVLRDEISSEGGGKGGGTTSAAASFGENLGFREREDDLGGTQILREEGRPEKERAAASVCSRERKGGGGYSKGRENEATGEAEEAVLPDSFNGPLPTWALRDEQLNLLRQEENMGT